jgi:hypothetical protein
MALTSQKMPFFKMPPIPHFYPAHGPLSRIIINSIADVGSVSVYRQKERYLL